MNRKPGDWNCMSCQNLNFCRRESCHLCGYPRSDHPGFVEGYEGATFGLTGTNVRPGDWYCRCGTHNFASRSSCFKCNAFMDGLEGNVLQSKATGFGDGGGGVARSGWKSGDWICFRSGCNEHNFASRTECFRCNAPRHGTNA